jgi:hypothetical protein
MSQLCVSHSLVMANEMRGNFPEANSIQPSVFRYCIEENETSLRGAA